MNIEKIVIRKEPRLEIGQSAPPFIIAELGSNWASLRDCVDSISQAKLAGASAVKFQAFTYEALYGLKREMGLANELPIEWLPKLKEKCDAVGIEFMCTAFSPELAEAVNPFVSVHKVASSDINHVRLLEKLNTFKKPVILSTGASSKRDITKALEILSDVPVVLLYCVAAYPAKEVDLGLIDELRETYKKHVGFSDHTVDVRVIPAEAVLTHKAVVIEKHFNSEAVHGPDSGHSLNREEFKAMVEAIRGKRMPLCYTREEKDMLLLHNRRLIATKDVPEGHVFQEGVNFGAYRSVTPDANGHSPFVMHRVHGQQALKSVKRGESIGPSQVTLRPE